VTIDINKEYRILSLDDIVGPLRTTIEQIKIPPQVMLFYGPVGTGKNLGAFFFSQKLGNPQVDVRNTVDNTAKGAESMITQFSAPPLLPNVNQIFILNEFTDFNKGAQRKWKDILQSPPERTYFFLCTNEPEKIIFDIQNRIQLKIATALLSESNAYILVHKLCKKHGLVLLKKKKRAIARGSGGRPRTIIKTIEAIVDSSDSSDSFIKNMLDTYSGEGNEEAFMKLFFLLADLPTTGVRRSGHDVPTLIKLIDETGMEAEGIRYKFLHMVYNRYNPRAKELFMSLVPPLSIGGEKFDLLARFIKLLKL
jgi:DNA polymerase III delta prime subunit